MSIRTPQERIATLDMREWVVVTPQQGRQIIGSPLGSYRDMRQSVLDELDDNCPLSLCPALEFAAEYITIQDPKTGRQGVQKVPMVSGVDFIMDACVEQVIFSPARIYFLSDASDADRKEYEKMVRTALDQIVALSASRRGIVTPAPGGILLGSNGR